MPRISLVSIMLGLGVAACSSAPGSESTSSSAQDLSLAGPHAIISFGDSLSDVGTYAVGEVKALGGGKYTVNSSTAKNWTEVLSSYVGRPAPCAAETGLDGLAADGFSVPVTTHAGCFNYAEGGARVTNPVGPGNAALGGGNAVIGQLTVPVVTQIQNYLAIAGGFDCDDLVTVLAGANDLFINLSTVGAGAETPAQGVEAMTLAGTQLAGYVKTDILGKGAKHVVVLTVPDVNKTPFGLSESAQTQGLITEMLTSFNTALTTGLVKSGALIIDGYAFSDQEAANPAAFGLTNITTPSCNLTPAVNPLGSSLVCTTSTLVTGALPTWAFADTVHPTPYSYTLVANKVFASLLENGWK
jgi:phospholipase/lecithinase/hemolysin